MSVCVCVCVCVCVASVTVKHSELPLVALNDLDYHWSPF